MGTVDDYLASLDADDAAVVSGVYALAREEAPDAEQGLGYGMPALVWHGKTLLSVMRAQKHVGVYPFSPAAVSAVADALDDLPGVSHAKGTIRFDPAQPLPDDVVRRLVRARMAQIEP